MNFLNEKIKIIKKKLLIIISDNNKIFYYSLWNADIYASYNEKSCSFKKHLDYANNLIIPQIGKSRWIVENFCDTMLYPGDLLYIPYKWKH